MSSPNPKQPERSAPPGRPSTPSLSEVFRSVPVSGRGWLRRLFAFAGPGYLVSVGYMDPGNWGTDIAGGAQFGYALLWVILLSNLMAMLLQTLCVRLGLATGRDLAQACRDYYKRPVAVALWLLCEIAIVACDLAEVVGSAVALNLLFHIPLLWGVLITGLDVLLLLGAMSFGFRKIEAVVVTLVFTVGICFAMQTFLAHPAWPQVAAGFVPSIPGPQAFVIALGILGATVMPHNLYLHSALVQTRASRQTPAGITEAIKFNTIDTIVALGAAFFVNAAILVVASAVFHTRGYTHVSELQEAHKLLTPLLGAPVAATAFAVALLASGQSSTITGTLAGQIVMEGFLNIRIRPWLRRIITRSLAIIPAMVLFSFTGGRDTVALLVMSQVVLSLQLSFAIFPLMMFTSDRRLMGEFVNPPALKIAGYATCLLIASLNAYYLYTSIGPLWLGVVAAAMIGFAVWVRYFYREGPAAA